MHAAARERYLGVDIYEKYARARYIRELWKVIYRFFYIVSSIQCLAKSDIHLPVVLVAPR